MKPNADPAAAKTGSGSETTLAACVACGQEFTYERFWTTLARRRLLIPARTRCDSCEAALEAEEERAAAEERRWGAYRRLLGRRGPDDRGSRLETASFAAFIEGPHNREALALAAGWCDQDPRPNLLVVGPIGSGKSYLAACLYNALHARACPAYWLNAASLMAQIRRGFGSREDAVRAGAKAEFATTAPVLVLDDLGKVHPGKDVSWVEETFYAIVDERYRDGLPTIVTTEWKSVALAERVGESVVSRLQDGAWVAGIRKPAEPYRRRRP